MARDIKELADHNKYAADPMACVFFGEGVLKNASLPKRRGCVRAAVMLAVYSFARAGSR